MTIIQTFPLTKWIFKYEIKRGQHKKSVDFSYPRAKKSMLVIKANGSKGLNGLLCEL